MVLGRRSTCSTIGLALGRILAATLCVLALRSASADVITSPGNAFSPSAQPASGSTGVALTGGMSFLAADGTVRVVPSNNGVPVLLRPNITAMSPLVISSVSANVSVSTSSTNVSAYLTPYNSYLAGGGVFNVSGASNGSQLLNVSMAAQGNASFPISVNETYVLVLGDSTAPVNATYRLTSLGTRTLPSGQVVTAILSPGNLATLSTVQSTGSAQLDLQVQQRTANANGYVTFFLADQQAAIQLAMSNYAQLTSGASQFSSGGSTAGRRLSQSGGGGFVGNIGGSSAAARLPPQSLSTDGADVASSAHAPLPRTKFSTNSTISIPVGSRASIQLDLQDNVGEAYLFAFYDPASIPGNNGSYLNYMLPSPSDPQVAVTAAFRLSSTVIRDTPAVVAPNYVPPSPPGSPPTPRAALMTPPGVPPMTAMQPPLSPSPVTPPVVMPPTMMPPPNCEVTNTCPPPPPPPNCTETNSCPQPPVPPVVPPSRGSPYPCEANQCPSPPGSNNPPPDSNNPPTVPTAPPPP